jgi:hypothetical protein
MYIEGMSHPQPPLANLLAQSDLGRLLPRAAEAIAQRASAQQLPLVGERPAPSPCPVCGKDVSQP